MAVKRQQAWSGNQRVDVPHLRSVDSGVASDFDTVAGQVMAGQQPLVVTGFTLSTTSAVGNAATALQLNVANGIVLHYFASQSGSFLLVPSTRAAETLNPVTNSRVSGSFSVNTQNYVGLDFTRSPDTTTSDLVEFLNVDTLLESGQVVPLARTLDYKIVISTTPFSAQTNILPIAVITTDANGNVATNGIQDARNQSYRLGLGGDIPNSQYSYPWSQGRAEEATEATSVNYFAGGDKVIGSDREWRQAVMSRLWELGGGAHWYTQSAPWYIRLARNGNAIFSTGGDNFLKQLTLNTTVTSGSISTGSHTVTLGTVAYTSGPTADVSVGDTLGINVGASDQEYVLVTAESTGGSTITANFAKAHSASAVVTRVDILWQGLTMVFANSSYDTATLSDGFAYPVFYNTIADQTTAVTGLTDLQTGQCLYVDIDTTAANPLNSAATPGAAQGQPVGIVGGTALSMFKGTLTSLGSPTTPGARQIMVWMDIHGQGIARDSQWAIGLATPGSPATISTNGIVTLNSASNVSGQPLVVVSDSSSVGTPGNAVALGLTRGAIGAGHLSIGNGSDDTTIDIGSGGPNTPNVNIAGNGGGTVNIGSTALNGIVNIDGGAFSSGAVNLAAKVISLLAGSGNVTIDSTSGGIFIGTLTGGSVNLGNSTTTTIQGSSIQVNSSGTINLTGTTASLNATSGAVSVGNGSGTTAVNIGTGSSGATSMTLGNTAGSLATLSILCGNGGAGGTINIGNEAAPDNINLGNTSVRTTIVLQSGNGEILVTCAGGPIKIANENASTTTTIGKQGQNQNLTLYGGRIDGMSIVVSTSTLTLTSGSEKYQNLSGGTVPTVVLPSPLQGLTFVIMNNQSASVNIDPGGVNLYIGSSTYTHGSQFPMGARSAGNRPMRVISDGSNWYESY